MRRKRALILAVILVSAFVTALTASALTVLGTNPLWLQEQFTDTAGVTLSGGACIDTAPPGVARLCESPWSLATDPQQPRYFVADKQGQAWLYASSGDAVTDVSALLPAFPVPVQDADWGREALAVLGTDGVVRGYAQDASGGLTLLPGYQVQVADAGSVAAGPGVLMVADPAAVYGYAWDGAALDRYPARDIPAAVKLVRISRDGARALAVLPDGSLQTWAWSGAGWVAGQGLPGPVKSAAFMPSGAGLWASDGQTVKAYAFPQGGGGLVEVAFWQISAQARAVTPGFAGQDALILTATGAEYYAAVPGSVTRVAAYSAAIQASGTYEPSGVVTGNAYNADHVIDMLRVEAQETLPPGTSSAYEVSTDCGVTWTAAPASTNVSVPPGTCIAWRVTLATTDPTQTPVVDVVDVYELAQQTRPAQQGEVVMRLVQ